MRPNKSLKNKSGTCNTVPMRSTRPKTFHSKILVPELRSTPPCQKVSELLEQQQLEQFTTNAEQNPPKKNTRPLNTQICNDHNHAM